MFQARTLQAPVEQFELVESSTRVLADDKMYMVSVPRTQAFALLLWLTTFVLVVFNAGLSSISAAAAAAAVVSDGHEDLESSKLIFETQEMKLEFTADLRKVIQKFQINVVGAEAHDVGDCHAQLHAALAVVDRLESQDLSRANQAEALKLVDSAQQSVSNCQSLILSHVHPIVHDNVADVADSASPVLQIQAARNYLYWLANQNDNTSTTDYNSNTMPAADSQLEDENSNGRGTACTVVDGTTCQYSSCAKGTGLTACAIGYASGVIGGSHGKTYVVVSDDDNVKNPSPGSLRYGVNLGGSANGGVWITFARDMIIALNDMIWIRSATTIDGRGFNVTITGKCIVLSGVTNVILHNFQVNAVGESDTVHIFADSSRVWVDHLTSFDAKLGLVSVLQGSTDVSISNSDLMNSNFNMLLGASDADKQDQNMRVTIFRNWFKDSMQRMPHCRWGKCHVINNLYTNWGYYALGGRVHAKIISESNVFVPARRMEVTPWFNGAGPDFDQSATILSFNDLLTNGSTFHQSIVYNPSMSMHPSYPPAAHYPPITPTSQLSSLVKTCSGALFGTKLKLCLMQYAHAN